MIERNIQIEKSVLAYFRTQLYDIRGFSPQEVVVEESYVDGRFSGPLDKTYLALGFNFDDGGEQAEMGSTLIRRIVTIEAFIFGTSLAWAETVMGAIQAGIWGDMVIPLLDIGASDTPSVVDYLEVPDRGSVRGERVPVRDPRPWEENLFRIIAKVRDECYAAV